MKIPIRLAACLLPVLAACEGGRGGAVDASGPAAALFADPARRVLTVGLGSEDGPPAALLADPIAARLTESGGHVVVLDRVPPFVRVYDRSGRLRSAFVREGGGPGETRFPATVATAGDSLVLLAGFDRRVAVFDLDGRLVAEQPRLPLTVAAAVSGCDGEWLLYGPRREAGSRARRARWLHRFRPGDPPRVESALADSIVSATRVGLAYGLVRSGDGVLLRHEAGTAPVAVRWECGSARPAATPLAMEGQSPAEVATGRQGGRTVESGAIRPGDRMQAGIAAVEGGMVVADLVVAEGGGTLTRLWGSGPGGSWTATLPRAYVLRDSRPGVGVLVQADEPVPHLFVLREGDLSRVPEPGS